MVVFVFKCVNVVIFEKKKKKRETFSNKKFFRLKIEEIPLYVQPILCIYSLELAFSSQ